MTTEKRTLRVAGGEHAKLAASLGKCAVPGRFLSRVECDDASGGITISLALVYAPILGCVPISLAPLCVRLEPMGGGWSAAPKDATVQCVDDSAIGRLVLSYCELTADLSSADRFRLVVNGTLKLAARDEDLLSFEELAFFGMAFLIGPQGKVELDLSQVRFDPLASRARAGSLCAQLRLIPKRLVPSTSGALVSQGFESLDGAYAIPKTLDDPWVALVLEFSLGRLGELADSADLTTELAIGWGTPKVPLFAGLKLPGSELAGRIGLQGIIGLKPSGTGLMLYEDSTSRGARGDRWVLLLRGVQFSLLVLSLPPNGGIDLEISGDPTGNGLPSWYCAYAEPPPR